MTEIFNYTHWLICIEAVSSGFTFLATSTRSLTTIGTDIRLVYPNAASAKMRAMALVDWANSLEPC
jgi:hypothetical protein